MHNNNNIILIIMPSATGCALDVAPPRIPLALGPHQYGVGQPASAQQYTTTTTTIYKMMMP